MKFKYLYIFFIASLFTFSSCNVDEVLNPNAPILEDLSEGATLADLKLLAAGLEATLRNDMNFHYQTTSMVGREYYDLRGTDPRYTSELIGKQGASLDPNGFLTTRSYFGRYRSIRNAIILKNAVANTIASLSQEEINGFNGYANSLIGFEMLLEASRQYENGLRTEVNDPDNLGAFQPDYQSTLNGIRGYLDDANTQLGAAGANLPFSNGADFLSTIPGGSAEAMLKFNNSILARLELYAGNYDAALSALGNSFLDVDGSMAMGAYYTFGGATGNDLPNLLYYVPNTAIYVAHPSYTEDIIDNDVRVSKVTLFDENEVAIPVSLDDLSGSYQVSLIASNTSPFPMVRNEELLLIWAEAQARKSSPDFAAAIVGLDAVRAAAGLPSYSGSMDMTGIMEDVRYQRRFGLFGEGHRWVDMRRWDRLDELPLDRNGDIIHVQFPRPAAEN